MSSYGLRAGACIKLQFVHVIQVAEQKWNMLRGFFCCSLSHLSLIRFSPHINSLYKVSLKLMLLLNSLFIAYCYWC